MRPPAFPITPQQQVQLIRIESLTALSKNPSFALSQGVGNGHDVSRRTGVTLAGIHKLQEEYKIDPKRIFVSGMSGGGRCASMLGFWAADDIAGVVAICGVEYDQPVPKVAATEGGQYGVNPAMTASASEAKRKVKFAIITGEKDWRRGNIFDVYNGGYAKDRFKAKLWDVPGMGHSLCNATVLAEALDFVEGAPGRK